MLRGAKLVTVAEDIGAKLSFHDCTLLLTRGGRAPYLVGCVAQIVVAKASLAIAAQWLNPKDCCSRVSRSFSTA